jgi:hypothetical protein
MTGNWDASGALTTKPAKTGTVLPATCSTGEAFFNTAATGGQNFYLCKPDNTWTQLTTGGHALAAVLACADSSSSAATYTCATTPTFTPAAGDVVLFTGINQSNSGTSTLGVNGQSPGKTIKKQQNAASLVSGDLAAGGAVLMEYDGTYWQMQGQIANAAGGGGGTSVNVNGSSISSPNFNSTTPAAGTGYTSVAFQVSGSNVSAEIQRELTATFLLCAGGCYAGETTNWKWTAPFALTFTGCVIDAVTYPTGAAVTVNLLKGGTTTIFSGAVPTLAGGSSAYATDTGMAANAAFTQGQYLIASVLTAGSTVAGQFVNVVCTATY